MSNIEVNREFATGCLKIIEIFLNKNNELDLISNTEKDGTIRLSFASTNFNGAYYGKR